MIIDLKTRPQPNNNWIDQSPMTATKAVMIAFAFTAISLIIATTLIGAA